MNLIDFLQALSLQGVRLRVEGEQLRSGGDQKVLTPAVISQLKQHKADILQLLQERPETVEVYPLSYAQRSLWFLWQLAPESSAYNESFATCLSTPFVDWRPIFQALIDRHPTLRSTFPNRQGEPIQQVHSDRAVDFQTIDATAWSQAALQQRMTQLCEQPFDLEQGPIIRVKHFLLAEQEQRLLITIHHIACDGWSQDLLLKELLALYQAQQKGQPANLLPTQHTYRDYVFWQRRLLTGATGDLLWHYWQKQLAGTLPNLSLPTDHLRPPVQTYQGASYPFELTEQLSQRLRDLAQKEGATLYMTLLAAFKVLLYRYAGQEDLIVGSATLGRSRPEFTPIVGYFVNQVVLRSVLSDELSFKALLANIRQTVSAALTHQDYPFAKLVEQLQPQRDPSRSPLFQVSFNTFTQKFQRQSLPPAAERLGLKPLDFTLPQREGQFDLSLEIVETPTVLTGTIKYNTDLFIPETIARMAGHFQTLLEALISDPEQPVGQLPLLTTTEQQQLIGWATDPTELPSTAGCVHSLFEAQVQQQPTATAVVFQQQRLTYAQLNARANQLARHLQTLGVGPEVRVGICVDRSAEMVVALLAVLKAGGAYVPLDPNYPAARLAFMLSDAQAPVLLTQPQWAETFADITAHCVDLAADAAAIAQQPDHNLEREVTASNLAYVLYTSGSTGRPKGVEIEHRSPAALLHWARDVFSAEQRAGVLASTSLCFDLSVFELFLPLCWGGQVILAENALQLPALPAAEEVTLINTVPSAMAELLRMQAVPASVRTVNLAGEALHNPLVQQIYRETAVKQVFNLYGPSEDTTYSTYASVPRGATQSPAIGRPIAQTEVYILDSALQLVPIGVAGELHIGGAGLARGYLNRPDLTAEKFISNPFGPGRLYKTGDLARYRADGTLEYLGRLDHQVKIRGFRIELSELEATLHQHEGIQAAAVTAHTEQSTDRSLVAYIVPHQAAPTSAQLRHFLKQTLPHYMVPAIFVFLEALPLSPNGKIDRRALPAPQRQRASSTEPVPPRTPTEACLVAIWSDLLGVDVGIEDDFFESGGHSLLATQVISRLRTALGIELPLRYVFEYPTIAVLSAQVERVRQEERESSSLAIQSVDRPTELPLSFTQQRLWFLDQLAEGQTAYNMPAAIRLDGQLNEAALAQAMVAIIQRHEVLRTTFHESDTSDTVVQVVGPPPSLPFETVDLQGVSAAAQPAEIHRLATAAAQQSFDLSRGPLISLKLLKLAPDAHMLLLTMHHIVADAWSIEIFLREVAALYAAYAAGQPSPLPALPIQYADYAVWQRQWLQGEVLETQLAYWQKQLAGQLPVLQLPADYPGSTGQNHQGASQSLTLSQALTEKLKRLSQQQGATLFMTLLTAFKILLYRYTDQEDMIVGTPIAGRHQAETEGLIGCFVNTLPLRTHLGGNPSFLDYLRQVRAIALGAYAHQHLPFEKLVEVLQPDRTLDRHPVFNVMFNFTNTPPLTADLSGLNLSVLPQADLESKFMLTLYAEADQADLKLQVVYQRALFSPERMVSFLDQFQALLEQIVAAPDRSIQSYSLITPTAQNLPQPASILPEPDYALVTARFETWANRTPEQPAVCQSDHTWSYGELARLARHLARALLTNGLKKGDVVAIYGKRSFGLIVSMIGVLLSGGVLLTLDQDLPEARHQRMFQEANAKYLIDLGSTDIKEITSAITTPILSLDPDTGSPLRPWKTQQLPLPMLAPADAAYIFFTSGSTGVPKGVLGCHKGIAHFLAWQQQTFDVRLTDRVAQLTRLSFDAILRDVFLPLCSGATLCLPASQDDLGADQILAWLEQAQVSLLHTVPAIAQSWLAHVPKSVTLRSLRWLFFSGEPLTETLVSQWRQAFPLAGSIVNLYGATETTMVKCYYPVPSEIPAGILPGGWPLPETQALILNAANQLCGVGELGEIYLRTPFRTLGYINAPDAARQRFVLNPFRDDPQDYLYRTGDRGRYCLDGAVEVLGRLDDQIKISGVRIQPGEIETVLNQHLAVGESAVIARDDIGPDKCLVAYFVTKPNQSCRPDDLRHFLKQHLPLYLVPARFVPLTALPLTATGKVDRQALPVPAREQRNQEASDAPRTELERTLVEVFTAVLQVEEIGRLDNFFELGGHSLLATQMVSRLRTRLKVPLPLRTVFEAPTPAELARAIAQLRPAKATEEALTWSGAITKVDRSQRRAKVLSSGQITLSGALRSRLEQLQQVQHP
ncbi:MAG: amino acid adenylation domain-containing protein [Phormidesmis sp.]